MKKPGILLMLLMMFSLLHAQEKVPVYGMRDNTPHHHTFVQCTLVTAPGKIIPDAELEIDEGKVIYAGPRRKITGGGYVHELNGAWIYPAFIDAYASWGMPEVKPAKSGWGSPPQYDSETKGPFSHNQAVKPEVNATEIIKADEKLAEIYRQNGFAMAHAMPGDGIFRGTSALVALGDEDIRELIRSGEAAAGLSFSKGSSTQSYPGSLMGAIALIRQSLYDAAWYQTAKDKDYNLSLEALASQLEKKLPIFFESGDYQNTLRAAKIADEFGLKFIFVTEGDEYLQQQAMKKLADQGHAFIIPLTFPSAYKIEAPSDVRAVDLQDLRRWQQAPVNPAVMEQMDIPFAFSSKGLKKPEEFRKNMEKAMKYGLSADAALAALTVNPAKMLGIEKEAGSLEPGKYADFIIASDSLFKTGSIWYETWVNGEAYIHQKPLAAKADIRIVKIPEYGDLGLIFDDNGGSHITVWYKGDTIRKNEKISSDRRFSLILPSIKDSSKTVMLEGYYSRNDIIISGMDSDGKRFTAKAQRFTEYPGLVTDAGPEKVKSAKKAGTVSKVRYPNNGYGFEDVPEAEFVLFTNATVWTNGKAGIMEDTDVIIKDGKIIKLGKDLKAPGGAKVFDLTGKHLTSGIIDEHSHIAIEGGVNEATHPVTAEVSIGDVVDNEDINIYRQLAGGVTISQLLHGSANPIGGQSAIIKLRWGMLPEEMLMAEAKPFIKFALGENVKQSNWGDNHTIRYPQTRPGVEQVMSDVFAAAKTYEAEWQKAKADKTLPLPRKDLQLETILQILNSERFVTCHSYVQSEINMLMKLAESYGFRINTFTHVLEGYKIADKLKKHGATASTFSDWWAYKFEVIDAIPYNAAIMADQGVNVCINSDDAEMGRRLNQEAAKAVLYGGVSEETAWKMVTLNPAKALRIDQYVGSVEPGKHADLVVWTDNPLSIYATVVQTWIDGRLYYDQQRDKQMREAIATEKQRIISEMMQSGEEGSKPSPKAGIHYHCETIGGDYE